MFARRRIAGAVAALLLTMGVAWADPSAYQPPVRIGLPLTEGRAVSAQQWTATLEHLRHALPGRTIELVPLPPAELHPALRNQGLQFLLSDGALSVEVQRAYGATRLATQVRNGVAQVGAEIFRRAAAPRPRTLSEARTATIAAVTGSGMDGWVAAAAEWAKAGIPPDSLSVQFLPSNEAVVRAVRDGSAAVGIVAAGALESLTQPGSGEFLLLNPQPLDPASFPYRRSTALYPGWSLSSLPHTPAPLAEAVTAALMTQPKTDGAGWTIAASHLAVREAVAKLRPALVSTDDTISFVTRYRHWLAATIGLICAAVAAIVILGHFVRSLRQTRDELVRELTQRQAAEQSLLVRTAALEAAEDMVFITSPTGLISYVNPSFTRHTGYTIDDVRGFTPAVLKSGHHDDGFYQRMWEVVLAGEIWHGDMVNRRKDGTVYYAEQTISPVRDADGHVMQLVSISRDVTERRRAQDELARMATLNRAILDSVEDAIVGMDQNGRTLFLNKAGSALLGFEERDLVGHSLHAMTHHSHADGSPFPAEQCPIRSTTAEGQAVPPTRDLFWTKDSAPLPVVYRSTPLRDPQGHGFGAVVSFHALPGAGGNPDAAKDQHQPGGVKPAELLAQK